jgi:hypothetical protein
MNRFVTRLSALVVAGMIAAPAAFASNSDNAITLRVAGGGGAALSSSPASACLTGTDDPNFAIIEFGYTGSLHENIVSGASVHIVADLSLTFDVRDHFGTHIAWQGAGSIAVDDVVPLSQLSADGVLMAVLTTTVPVVMTAPDGRTVSTSWPIQIFAFNPPRQPLVWRRFFTGVRQLRMSCTCPASCFTLTRGVLKLTKTHFRERS